MCRIAAGRMPREIIRFGLGGVLEEVALAAVADTSHIPTQSSAASRANDMENLHSLVSSLLNSAAVIGATRLVDCQRWVLRWIRRSLGFKEGLSRPTQPRNRQSDAGTSWPFA